MAESQSTAQTVDREHDLRIRILVAVLIVVGILLIVYFFMRRVRKQQQKRMQDLENGLVEVKESHAMRFLDDTLKGVSDRSRSWESYHSSPFSGKFNVPSGVVPHRLFHPGIKRSRSIQSPQPIRLQLPRQTPSYPHLKRYPSSLSTTSFNSYLNKPMSPSTTMQTRRPETPPPAQVEEIIMKATTPPHLRQVRSIWSFSAASSVPSSSPSVYSTTPPRAKLFEPSRLSIPRDTSPEPYSLPASPLPSPPLSIHDPDEPRPRLHSLQPPPQARNPSPPPPLPTPKNTLRQSIPIEPLPLSAALDQHEFPNTEQTLALAALLSLPPFVERPLTEGSDSTIERWLDGDTGTASVLGSILGESEAATQPRTRRIQSLSLSPRVQSVRSSIRRLSESGPQWIGAAF
jgi:hypothetical protein